AEKFGHGRGVADVADLGAVRRARGGSQGGLRLRQARLVAAGGDNERAFAGQGHGGGPADGAGGAGDECDLAGQVHAEMPYFFRITRAWATLFRSSTSDVSSMTW